MNPAARSAVRHAADLLAEHGHEVEAECLDAVIKAMDAALLPDWSDMPNEDELEQALLDVARNPPPTTDSLTATFAAIEHLAAKTIPDLAVLISPDYAGLAALLQALRRAIAQLRFAETELEDELVKVLPGRDTEIPGVGMATLRTGTKRTQWDKTGIVAAVTARIADEPSVFVDTDTGEFLPPAQVAERIITAFLEVGTPSWKTTGLRAMTINPDEYCETVYGRKTVQLPSLSDADLFTKTETQ